MKLKDFYSVFVLTLCATFATAETTVNYEGNNLPEDNYLPFTIMHQCGGQSSVHLANGILSISDNDAGLSCNYYYRNDSMDIGDFAVASFRMKVISSYASEPPDNRSIQAGFIDGRKVIQLGFSETNLGFLDGYGLLQSYSYSLDTTEFHSYRIVKNGDQAVSVYVDGNLVLEVPYENLLDNNELTAAPRQSFGAGSRTGISESEWDYFRYTISSSAPSKPEISVSGGFIKMDTTNGNQPDFIDCSTQEHYGRTVIDDVAEILYICTQNGWSAH